VVTIGLKLSRITKGIKFFNCNGVDTISGLEKKLSIRLRRIPIGWSYFLWSWLSTKSKILGV